MKKNWPTLQGRLNNAFTSELEALEQCLRNGDILSDFAKRRLERLRIYEQDKKKAIPAL